MGARWLTRLGSVAEQARHEGKGGAQIGLVGPALGDTADVAQGTKAVEPPAAMAAQVDRALPLQQAGGLLRIIAEGQATGI